MPSQDKQRADTQVVGNAGLYFCCYHLSLLGWNVMPTARNAKGIDILAYSQDAKAKLAIQVKTLSKRNPVPLGNSLDKIMGDWWIIVNKVATHPTAFILLPDEVISLAKTSSKDGKEAHWLQPPQYDQDAFREKWDRIGRGNSNGPTRSNG